MRKLKDKYRRLYDINKPGILGSTLDEVAEEKLIKVITKDLDISTTIYVEAKTLSASTWERVGTMAGTSTEVFDISLYDQIRYNVFSYGGTPSSVEAVSAVESDQNLIEKDINDDDTIRVIDAKPVYGDDKTAYLNALVTMQFWGLIGFDANAEIDFVTDNDSEPLLTRDGDFIEV